MMKMMIHWSKIARHATSATTTSQSSHFRPSAPSSTTKMAFRISLSTIGTMYRPAWLQIHTSLATTLWMSRGLPIPSKTWAFSSQATLTESISHHSTQVYSRDIKPMIPTSRCGLNLLSSPIRSLISVLAQSKVSILVLASRHHLEAGSALISMYSTHTPTAVRWI